MDYLVPSYFSSIKVILLGKFCFFSSFHCFSEVDLNFSKSFVFAVLIERGHFLYIIIISSYHGSKRLMTVGVVTQKVRASGSSCTYCPLPEADS